MLLLEEDVKPQKLDRNQSAVHTLLHYRALDAANQPYYLILFLSAGSILADLEIYPV